MPDRMMGARGTLITVGELVAASLGVLHVLHDQEGGAEVNKAADGVLVAEQLVEHFDKLLFTVVHINKILVLLD